MTSHDESQLVRVSPIGPVGVAMIVASLAFLAAGIAWPHAAGVLLRVLLATLPVGYIAARAHDAMLSVRTTKDRTPFDGITVTRTPPATPQVIRSLASDLVAANSARRSRRTAIPWPARQTVIAEATHRLAERHGLDLRDVRHHPQIRSLVAGATWQLLDPARIGTVTLSELDDILDDLERL